MPEINVDAASVGNDGTVRKLDREGITTGRTEVPINFYRTDSPPIFCGFQVEWISGTDPNTGTTFDLNAGAGVGSKYATLRVTLPDGTTVYEYLDVTELVTDRLRAIIAEQATS